LKQTCISSENSKAANLVTLTSLFIIGWYNLLQNS
jgi:hypothetical protein